MVEQMGVFVLGCLSLLSAAYGALQLLRAYRVADFSVWRERAFLAVGAVLLAAVFAHMTAQALASAVPTQGHISVSAPAFVP